MRRTFSILVMGLAGAAAVNCAHEAKAPLTTVWLNDMHRLSASYTQILSVTAEPGGLARPENRKFVQSNLHEMQLAASAIAHRDQSPTQDPIIAYASERLAGDIAQASAAFEAKDYQWAHYSLNQVGAYCINCHTRSNAGIKNYPITWQAEFYNLAAVPKIEAFLANRQYASAVSETHAFASARVPADVNSRQWELTVERTMAVLVRVNEDPKEAKVLAAQVANNTTVPSYIRRDARAWLDDIRVWENEKSPETTASRLKLAKAWVSRASSRPHTQANLIASLRASGLLHGLLNHANPAQHGDILYQAGLVAQSLRDLNLGFLDQFYFERCIRTVPHSDLAEECYVELETSVRDGGLFFDIDPGAMYLNEARLAPLRQLAEVKNGEK